MRLLINFASRSRPLKFFNCLDNLRQFSTLKNYFVLAKCDSDDFDMNTHAVIKKLDFYPEVEMAWGYSSSKVAAINRDIDLKRHHFDILINFSDDQLFLVKGFDQIIVDDMKNHFPDTDGFLHYPDSHTGSKIPTMSIMGRAYYERDMCVYEPNFENVYADNYAMDVAKKRGKYVFVNQSIYDHFHPVYKMTDWDEQYLKTDSKESFAKDRATYLKLRAENFGA